MTTLTNEDSALRPQDFSDYVGQERLKKRLQVMINGALTRNEPLGHTLLTSAPGQGKTSLAALIADEMMMDFHSFMMPMKTTAVRKAVLDRPGVIFFDEVHRQPKAGQEELLLVLEDGVVTFDDGKKVKITHPFTIIAATTELTKVIPALRDRFHFQPKFEEYSVDEMSRIVTIMAHKLDIDIPREHAKALGRASAATPRQARNLIRAARDLDTTDPAKVLDHAGITKDGLTEDHLDYLVALNRLNDRAGIKPLSNLTGLPQDIIVQLEQLLLKRGYIDYTAKGRALTVRGLETAREAKSKKNK